MLNRIHRAAYALDCLFIRRNRLLPTVISIDEQAKLNTQVNLNRAARWQG